MKWLVWLLLLLNIGLLIYFNMDVIAPKPVASAEPINPEKLIILTQKQLADMPKKAVAAAPADAANPAVAEAPAVNSCFEWGSFTSSNLPSAQVALVKLGLEGVSRQTAANPEDRRFWVYYPPLKNAELALVKADEIRAMGVTDLFIVQDSQWRNAISFGLFQDEQLAINFLKDLHEKGVKNATKSLRNQGKVLTTLLIKSANQTHVDELQKITPEFVGSELKKVACP
jgi:hypothetical protein